eukprot:s119_g1.t1
MSLKMAKDSTQKPSLKKATGMPKSMQPAEGSRLQVLRTLWRPKLALGQGGAGPSGLGELCVSPCSLAWSKAEQEDTRLAILALILPVQGTTNNFFCWWRVRRAEGTLWFLWPEVSGKSCHQNGKPAPAHLQPQANSLNKAAKQQMDLLHQGAKKMASVQSEEELQQSAAELLEIEEKERKHLESLRKAKEEPNEEPEEGTVPARRPYKGKHREGSLSRPPSRTRGTPARQEKESLAKPEKGTGEEEEVEVEEEDEMPSGRRGQAANAQPAEGSTGTEPAQGPKTSQPAKGTEALPEGKDAWKDVHAQC